MKLDEIELLNKMKITIYELLELIKDGKAPKKIEFDTEKYLWCEEEKEYRRYPYENNLYYSLWSDYDLTKCLNDEVEIIEEYKDINKIEELEQLWKKLNKTMPLLIDGKKYYKPRLCIQKLNKDKFYNNRFPDDWEEEVINKIDELIDEVNKIKKEGK